MIRYLYADQISEAPLLAETMFRDRAAQFRDRLNWDVTVDANGFERDQYDAFNPLYVILADEGGRHAASMRVLPTVGRTMVNDHFRDLAGGVAITSPLIWECTRFCLRPDAGREARRMAGSVMLAGCHLGLRFGLDYAVGVFNAQMLKIYRGIGWEPEVIGRSGPGTDAICVGLWPFAQAISERIAARAGVDPAIAEGWFEASFPARRPGQPGVAHAA
jgi:acyl homoserine lactone synthase